MDNLWGVITIVGPIVLIIGIAYAMLRNRQTPAQEARTEQATREMYAEQECDDKAEAVDE